MCIGQDVRGNIKLSLKATSSPILGNRAEADEIKPSTPPPKETPTAPASSSISEESFPIGGGEKQSIKISDVKTKVVVGTPESSSVPVILIRSAAECEEEEKAFGLTQKSKTKPEPFDAAESKDKPAATTRKSKTKSNNKLPSDRETEEKKANGFAKKESSKTNPADKRRNGKSPFSLKIGAAGSSQKLKTEYVDRITELLQLDTTKNLKITKKGGIIETQVETEGLKRDLVETEVETEDLKCDVKVTKAETKSPIAKGNLRLGTEVTAKVDQIRTLGLVLDLGGGLRGMLRKEV